MTNATFHNFTDKSFTGYWDGKPKTFAPGEKKYMPAWLAEHFAKHLTNRVLIETGKEVYTSPKNPAQVPEFMEVFKKAFIPEPVKEGANSVDDIIDSANAEPSMNIEVREPVRTHETAGETVARGEPTVITPPGGDDEDEFDLGDQNKGGNTDQTP